MSNTNKDLSKVSNPKIGAAAIGFTQSGSAFGPRNLSQKLAEGVSVKDHGAVGDGIANDAPAFVAAAAANVAITIPEGTYKLDTDVTTTSSFTAQAGVAFTGVGILYATVNRLSSIYPGRKKTMADVLAKANAGTAITIACYGDSITYGQDTSGTGVATQINGATQTRSPYPFPESLAEALAFAGFTGGATVANRGFPGDSSAQGVTRWSASAATDVAILMYGHNDANAYGGNPLVSVPNFRRNMVMMVEREIAKGAAVIIMLPPNVAVVAQNNLIRPFAEAAKKVAEEYGVPYVDAVQQLASVSNMWTDGIHLNQYAYNELGWHLSALFLRRDSAIKNVNPGAHLVPQDMIGVGGTITTDANSKGGYFQTLTQGQTYAIGVHVENDCHMIMHSYNTGSTPVLTMYYAGNRGFVPSSMQHVAASGIRQSLISLPLTKGYRTIFIRNDTATAISANLEAFEFVGNDQPQMVHGVYRKSNALSGMSQPMRAPQLNSGVWFVAADYSRRLTAPYNMVSKVRIGDSYLAGVAILADKPTYDADAFLNLNAVIVFRSGADLILRELIGGATGTDVTTTNVFVAGDFLGEIEIEMVAGGATLNVYVDGVLKATKNPTNKYGYPAMYAASAGKMDMLSCWVGGYVKSIFQ